MMLLVDKRKRSLAALSAAVAALTLAAQPAGARTVRSVSSFTPAGVEGLYGIAVDQATGSVYVSGRSSGNIGKYSASGVRDTSFVSPELSFPAGVAVDNSAGASRGDLYASDFAAETVLKLQAEGEPALGFTPPTTGSFPPGTPGSEEFRPFGVAVDPENGDLVVADHGNEEVDIFSSSGAFISQFPVSGVFGVAVGANGQIFTSGGGGAQSWSPADEYSTPTTVDPAEMRAIAVDAGTEHVFADAEEHIAEYDTAGTLLFEFGSGLLEGESFGVAADAASGAVYVSDQNGQVYAFGPALTYAQASTSAPATDVTSTSASVAGTVDPEGTTVSSCVFEYGTGTSYGQSAPCAPPPPLTGTSALVVTATLQALRPSQTYHYRLAVTNAAGSSYGEDRTFTTSSVAPLLDGESVSAVTATSAILDARINPNDQATTYRFEYGTTTAYGTTVPTPEASAGSGYGDVNVGEQLAGLQPNTTYHYRVVATSPSSPAGGNVGPDRTFTTPTLPLPVVTTGPGAGVGANSATLTATIETAGYSTDYEFDFGTDTSYGTRVFGSAGTEAGSDSYTVTLQGLMPGTTYHYRIVATNAFGTVYGADEIFTTATYPSSLLTEPVTPPLVPAPLLASAGAAAGQARAARAASAGAAARRGPANGSKRKRRGSRSKGKKARRAHGSSRGGK